MTGLPVSTRSSNLRRNAVGYSGGAMTFVRSACPRVKQSDRKKHGADHRPMRGRSDVRAETPGEAPPRVVARNSHVAFVSGQHLHPRGHTGIARPCGGPPRSGAGRSARSATCQEATARILGRLSLLAPSGKLAHQSAGQTREPISSRHLWSQEVLARTSGPPQPASNPGRFKVLLRC